MMSGRDWTSGRALGYAAAGVVDLGASAWLLRRARFGGIGPLSAATSTMSLMLGVAVLAVAVRTWRWHQASSPGLVVRLAGAVGWAEQRARQPLLDGHDRAIDVEVDSDRRPKRHLRRADVTSGIVNSDQVAQVVQGTGQPTPRLTVTN